MLFGRWPDLGRVKNVLALLTVLFTYVQAFWFWFSGYKQSDELVCGTAESELGSWKLFSQHARWAIIVLYIFGIIVVLPDLRLRNTRSLEASVPVHATQDEYQITRDERFHTPWPVGADVCCLHLDGREGCTSWR
jgi:hypothetical protein